MRSIFSPLLLVLVTTICTVNSYAPDAAVSPQNTAAITAAIENHPTVQAAEARGMAAIAREKAACDIMMAALDLCIKDPHNTTNFNKFIEAKNNWSPLAAAMSEAAEQCKKARHIIASWIAQHGLPVSI